MKFLTLASRNFKETYRDRFEFSFMLTIPLGTMLVFGILVKGEGLGLAGVSVIDIAAPGLMLGGLLFLVSFSGTLLALDRTKGFLSRLMTTPVKPFEFILSYSLGFVPVAIGQIIIYILVAWIMGMSMAGSPLLLFLILFLTGLNFIALGMILGSLTGSKGQAEGLSFLIVLPILSLSGATLLAKETMPPILVNIAYAFPFARAIDAVQGVNLIGLGLKAVSYDLLFLAAYAVVFFTMGIILFRNCLVGSRIRSVISYTMAVVMLVGLLVFGFYGGDLRSSRHMEGFKASLVNTHEYHPDS